EPCSHNSASWNHPPKGNARNRCSFDPGRAPDGNLGLVLPATHTRAPPLPTSAATVGDTSPPSRDNEISPRWGKTTSAPPGMANAQLPCAAALPCCAGSALPGKPGCGTGIRAICPPPEPLSSNPRQGPPSSGRRSTGTSLYPDTIE